MSFHNLAYDHTHIPGHDQKAALAGTSGNPSVTNCYVTNSDSRNTDARTPTSHASSHQPGGADAMAVDAAAGTGSLRTLGTTATSACAGNDSRLSDARTPTAHKTSHEPGGADAMAVDAAAGTGSLRTLGTSATSACAGSDSRLSDARTPTSHASTHVYGGGDEVIPARDVATLTNGTGSASVQGQVVQIYDSGADGTFITAAARVSATMTGYCGYAVGVVLDDGIADGQPCRVVVSGLAQVLVEVGGRGQPLTAHESIDGSGAGIEYSATNTRYAQGLGVIRDTPPAGGGLTWCILQVQHDLSILISGLAW
jgi:hypothetical protein